MKFTMNLETELRKQNRKVITPQQLLAIEQYDRISDDTVLTILERSGLKGTFEEGQQVKNKLAEHAAMISKFPAEGVFHISQIKNMAEKYQLKFLPAKLYKGQVPTDLGQILCEQEIAHKFQLTGETTFIMAPASSFHLRAWPKDPLAFHKINDEYYYLLHKWGSDLSRLRRARIIFERYMCLPLMVILPILIVYLNKCTVEQIIGTGLFALFSTFMIGMNYFDSSSPYNSEIE